MDTQCFSSRVLPQASCAVEERASDMLLKGKRTSRARPTVRARSPPLRPSPRICDPTLSQPPPAPRDEREDANYEVSCMQLTLPFDSPPRAGLRTDVGRWDRPAIPARPGARRGYFGPAQRKPAGACSCPPGTPISHSGRAAIPALRPELEPEVSTPALRS